MAACQACRVDSLVEFLDLGDQPICNKFLDNPAEFDDETYYPLKVAYCPTCHLVQLTEVPPLEVVFGEDFNYLSSATATHVEHFETLAESIISTLDITRDDYVVDIGSNDGTFLNFFANSGADILGIEPAQKPAALANEAGIKTINDRFEDSLARVRQVAGSELRLVTAMNVLAHTDDIHSFLDGVETVLSANPRAHFISQSHYLPELIENCEYDTIYHEHARYFSLTSMKNLFEMYDLTIYHVERSSYYGGSVIVYATHADNQPQVRNSVRKMLGREQKYKSLETYERFARNVEENREKLLDLLDGLITEGNELVGVGAPMKSSTLLNYCGIGVNYLQYITEVNPLKIGTYTPGTHIEVVDERRIFTDEPDVAVILSWNVSDSIISSLREKGYTGSFVIPIPEPKHLL